MSAERTRNFTTLVYPESAPENWLTLLEETHVMSFVSPLHDSDVNELDGEYKKPHYHVVISYDSVKTVKQAQELVSLIGGVGCKKVQSMRGVIRYLTHMDNPEKFQYDENKVICLNGADYLSSIESPSNRYDCISQMIQFCEENNIFSYRELLLYSMKNNEVWFRSLCDNSTMVIKEYLKSSSWDLKCKVEREKEELELKRMSKNLK